LLSWVIDHGLDINRKGRRIIMKKLLIFTLVITFTAGFGLMVNNVGAKEKEVVRIAYVAIMAFAPIYVAAERGYFAEQGIDTEFVMVKSGTECMAFLTEGKVSVGAIAVVASAWNAFNKGMDLRIVAAAGLKLEKDDPAVLLVRTDLYESGEVRKLFDLKGRRVAMAGGPGSGGEYMVAKALEGSGLTIFDLRMIDMANPDMPLGLKTKAIDAALTSPPYSIEIMMSGTGKILAKDMTPGAMTVVFMYSGKFMKEKPEVAKKFMIGLMKGARAMQGKNYLQEKNIEAYMKYTRTTEDVLRKTIPMLYDPNLTIKVESLRDIERVHMGNGRLSYSNPMDLGKVVDSTFQEYAVSVLGKAAMIPPVIETIK
jgi:NitT/TauT family transport system substrate-binding protein